MKGNTKAIRSGFLLFLAASIWGAAFVAQSVGMDYMGPATFNAARFLLGGAVLLPVLAFRAARGPERALEMADPGKKGGVRLAAGGICCGLALCGASLLQQIGIQDTAVGKAGFLTTLYIVIVPLIGIFLGKRAGAKVWGAAAMALAGMYLLCMSGSPSGAGTSFLTVGRGDAFVLGGAVLFSVHILAVDRFSPGTDSVALSCIQFFTSGAICTVLALLTEAPSVSALMAGALPVLYAGVLSCGVAYTLQVVGQKEVEPAAASLILSLESVVSVLAGWAVLGQRLSGRELAGCALVFAAVILVQLPGRAGKQPSAIPSGSQTSIRKVEKLLENSVNMRQF
mgnify:FL=1